MLYSCGFQPLIHFKLLLTPHDTMSVEVLPMERKGSGGRPRFGTPRTEKCDRLNITITQTLHERLEKFCEDDERAKSWVIQKALEAWLDGKGY